MTHHPLRARVRRLELRIAAAERPSIAERLQRALARRATMSPAELASADRASLTEFAGREAENSLAGRLARAGLRLLAAEESKS